MHPGDTVIDAPVEANATMPAQEPCNASEAPALLPPCDDAKPPAKRARRSTSADAPKEKAGKKPTKADKETEGCKDTEETGDATQGEETSGGRASLYIVTKAVRNFLKGLPVPIHCGADFIPALNTMLQQQLNDAVSRAKANGRKTVRSSDL